MAIIGKIEDLAPLFGKTEELEYLFSYIQSLFKEDFLSQIAPLQAGDNFQTPLQYEMFAITHCYTLKDEKDAFYESHQSYIDFQIVLEGFERYLITSKDHCLPLSPYDSSKDLEIYSPKDELHHLILRSKEMCILFPYDIHAVGIGKEREVGQLVKKVIIKVPKKYIKHRL